MRTYRNATVITALLTLASIAGAAYFNFFIEVDPFWCNLTLGVFGSGLVTFITSVIGYRVERRKTFEGFSYATKQILKRLNKYQLSWPLEQKIDYFLDFHDLNLGEWDQYYGDFCFMFDLGAAHRNYIFSKIYRPIQVIDHLINLHVWHFRYHKDGSGRKELVMERFVKEIEDLIMGSTIPQTKNEVVINVSQELNGEYYRLMYGNKVYRKSLKDTSA